MSDASTSWWLPIVTLVLGYALKSVENWLQNRRALILERETRRISFQRQTLLDLQDALMDLARCASMVRREDIRAFHATGKWHTQLLPEELDEKFRLAQSRTRLLSVRVRDDRIRELTEEVKQHATTMAFSSSKDESIHSTIQVSAAFDAVNERIGVILRTLDDAD